MWVTITDRINWYGYRPIFDSMQLMLSISSYSGDTLQPQKFGVYRVLNNDYINNHDGDGDGVIDSIFFTSFDPVKAGCIDESKPLFTFVFPDGKTTGPATTTVTMQPTAEGLAYVNELMMLEGDYKNDSTVYVTDSLWVNYFCGLAILPLECEGSTGATFATTLSESGMIFYGRNRDTIDQTLIRDTTETVFYFYDSYSTDYGNVSINMVDHSDSKYIDYAGLQSQVASGTIDASEPISIGYVEGMGGSMIQLTFTDEFMEQLGTLQEEYPEYRSVAINQALLNIYVDGVTNGGWSQDFSDALVNRFDYSISRLGLYTSYNSLTPAADYAWDYEDEYDITLPYGGYLNRSLGCYVCNIAGHVQRLWRAYQEAPVGEDGKKQYTDAQKKLMTLYIAPEATDLFTFNRVALQGGIEVGENAPIHMELTYTLIK
jgi:hypothetical protein